MKKIYFLLVIVLGCSMLASAQEKPRKKKSVPKSGKEIVVKDNGDQSLGRKLKQEQLTAQPILLKPRLVKN